ncbi:hypothetical protein E3N88_34568 [Mikania micrantha]|uniref:Uncharacterized protein n=1 Tax=Mikania micrantha TaxID=192012 RepID=A0A5N6LYM7_9ASTR|nr:hypothetical protein E3N88_34568 [Mikania micrantha]
MASIFLQTIYLAYLLVVLSRSASLLSHDEECSALFEFKQTMFYQDYDYGLNKLDSWRMIKSNASENGSGSDCCFWDGVECSNEWHVIGLDLGKSSLSGVINSSSTLFKLVHLQMLNLSLNFFESQIPSEIAHLKHLRSLDLRNSNFEGQIPAEISHLQQLSLLDLSWNPLELQSHGLGYLLQNMTRLENLHLTGVDLSSSVPRFLANFSSLRYIKLISCNLQDEFPSEIFHLPKLIHLGLRKNPNLTGSLPEFHLNTLLKYLRVSLTGFTGVVPESIGNLNHLEVLDLETCHFFGRLPGSLSNLTQLTSLTLYENEFTGLVPSLESLSKLTVLRLGFNNFEIGREYNWIKKLTKLIDLDLDQMNIHDEILPYLANLTKLRFVTMGSNFVFGRIPTSIMNLTQLTILDLQGNQLQGQISNLFLNFKNLEYLSVAHNNLSGTVGLESFSGLMKLNFLLLDGNRFSFITTSNYTNESLPQMEYLGLSSCNLKEFPAFLQFQMQMTCLLLYENEIKGLIPNWFLNNSRYTLRMLGLTDNFITGFHEHPHFLPWINLEVFQMSNNQLQGRLPIPPETIVIYDVSNNNLRGDIPSSMCELESLQLLDLSSNKMSGTLPPCLGNLNNSLVGLDLKQNNFHGPMMSICSHGSLLKKIDLSENRFTGQVSKSLANCTNLEFLSLADNSFEDVFPFWLGTIPKFQVLLLRSNKFNGTIESLSTMNSSFLKLRIIDISNNYFTGQLPDKSFQTWNAMKSVYVGESTAMESQFSIDNANSYKFQYSMTLANKVLGVGSGLVIGIASGNFLYARYGDWLLVRFGMKKDRWVWFKEGKKHTGFCVQVTGKKEASLRLARNKECRCCEKEKESDRSTRKKKKGRKKKTGRFT